jgi:DnaJ-class molecular chaperone
MVESAYNLIMESKLNPFDILQISEYSTNDEIRERYLLMSKTFHPDKQPLENWNLTKQYFENIDRAYKLIST